MISEMEMPDLTSYNKVVMTSPILNSFARVARA